MVEVANVKIKTSGSLKNIITEEGENQMIVMDIETSEKTEQMLNLRKKVLQAEQERLEGVSTLSVSEVRKKLRERMNK